MQIHPGYSLEPPSALASDKTNNSTSPGNIKPCISKHNQVQELSCGSGGQEAGLPRQGRKNHYTSSESKLYRLSLKNMYLTNFIFLLTKPVRKRNSKPEPKYLIYSTLFKTHNQLVSSLSIFTPDSILFLPIADIRKNPRECLQYRTSP